MFQNYFKTALRHLKNHKSHVAINVVGLGFGIASCLIAYLLWNFDTDFDRFHTKADQLYRINTVKSNTQELYGIAPAPLADLAKQNIAGVEDAVIMDFDWTTMNVATKPLIKGFFLRVIIFCNGLTLRLLRGLPN